MRRMWVRPMGQELLWGTCGSDLCVRSCCGAHVGQINGAGDAVGQMWVRSMGQEMLWGRSMGQELLWGTCGSGLWGRSCCGHMWVRSMGQELLLAYNINEKTC